MFSSTRQPLASHWLKVSHIGRSYSTQNTKTTILKSNSYRTAALGLLVGVPVGYLAQKSYADAPQAPSLVDFSREGSLEWKNKVCRPFNLEDVATAIRKEESTYKGLLGSGVQSWSSVRYGSNPLVEDNYVASQCSVGIGQPWLFWGVFDGHAGWQMSVTLKEVLVPRVAHHLSKLFKSVESPAPEAVDNAVLESFVELDDEVISDGVDALRTAKTLGEVLSRLDMGRSGSCALLSIYDPISKILRVACTGDSRAVLGSRDAAGKYTATALSKDQTGFDPNEVARIAAAHPGEPDVIDPQTGRVLGIAVSRAFGDGRWKWPNSAILEMKEKYGGRSLLPKTMTPPYLTAEPVVTATQLKSEGEFAIMASDGLWDHLSNEQAVKLVEMWLVARKEGTIGKGPRKAQPVTTKPLSLFAEHSDHEAQEKNFVVEDENVATHLVRNAFGGADHERLCAIVGAQSPLSRDVRDDITVQVIFFEDGKR